MSLEARRGQLSILASILARVGTWRERVEKAGGRAGE